MRADNKKGFSLFYTFLAGLLLLAVVGAHQNFFPKKFLTVESDNIELLSDFDVDSEDDFGWPLDEGLPSEIFSIAAQYVPYSTPKLYQAVHTEKIIPEGRLYILFQQLKLHTA